MAASKKVRLRSFIVKCCEERRYSVEYCVKAHTEEEARNSVLTLTADIEQEDEQFEALLSSKIIRVTENK